MDPEYEAIRQSLPTLKDFLIHCPHAAADEFYAKDLIPEELKRKVYNDPEKVGELIQCLSSRIKSCPGIFVDVLKVLLEMRGSDVAVQFIKEKYGNLYWF